MTNQRAYLACPYSTGLPIGRNRSKTMQERFLAVQDAAAWLKIHNWCVYSPIAHWHQIARRFHLPTGYAFWEEQDVSMMQHWATHLIILTLDGWNKSEGIQSEIEFIIKQNKEIFLLHQLRPRAPGVKGGSTLYGMEPYRNVKTAA